MGVCDNGEQEVLSLFRKQVRTHFRISTIYLWCVLMCYVGLTVTNHRTEHSSLVCP